MSAARLRSLLGGQHAERLGPQDDASPLWNEHIARYRWAKALPASRALDIACGAGIGFDSLRGPMLVGGDRSPDALRVAAQATAPASLCQLDVGALPFRAGSFDLITCFETIEHIEDDHGLVAELGRVVHPSGVALVSTPVRGFGDEAGEHSGNPFHVREYAAAELLSLLRPAFSTVELLGQVPSAAFARNGFWSPSTDLGTRVRRFSLKVAMRLPAPARGALERVRGQALFPGVDDFEFTADAVDRAPVLLAVCRR
jgi:SAM-dependent methyltransferase